MSFNKNLIVEDSPMAEHLANELRHSLAWTAERGWLQWNGVYWEQIAKPAAIEIVRLALLDVFNAITRDPANTDAERKAAMRLLGKVKAAAVLYFLEGLLHVAADEWDAEPDLLNCLNYVVDLRNGATQPHNPELRFTKVTGAAYNPAALHLNSDWAKTLEAMPEGIREWMQTRYGQAATGYTVNDDVLPIQKGSGSNGKSTMVDAIAQALGDFAVYVPEKVLLASPNEHPTDLMTLYGTRLAIIEELPEGRHLPTKRLKDLVGTSRMTARLMRQDYVSWDATHSLFVNTNYVPQVSETDHGTWRRLALVNFPYKFIDPSDPVLSPNDRVGDPGLRQRLKANEIEKATDENGETVAIGTTPPLEAVLSWVIQGAMRWYELDRKMPPVPLAIQEDTQAWREDADLIMAYARHNLVFDPDSQVLSTELFADFEQWLSDKRHSPWTDQTFAARFSGHELAANNHVEKRQVSVNTAKLSRRMGVMATDSPPKRAMCWIGVRFATVEAAEPVTLLERT